MRVSVVEPGPIRSQFSERAFGSLPSETSNKSYEGAYAMAGDIRSTTDRASFGPEHVAAAVRRAIGSRFPRARYMAPWFLAIPFAFMPLVPTRLLDAIFRRVFRLNGKPAPQLGRPVASAS